MNIFNIFHKKKPQNPVNTDTFLVLTQPQQKQVIHAIKVIKENTGMAFNWAEAGKVTDVILHDVILFGTVAASIFVKNAASQERAGLIIQALAPLLPILDAQLTGETATAQTNPTLPAS